MTGPTRRGVLAAAAGLPLLGGGAVAGTTKTGTPPLLMFDANIAEGRRFADRARAFGAEVLAIEGDRVRFAAPLLARRPHRIVGVTRHADRLLIAGMAEERGYRERLAVRNVDGRCATAACGAWAREEALLAAAGDGWPEALAALAGGSMAAKVPAFGRTPLLQAIGWVLTLPG